VTETSPRAGIYCRISLAAMGDTTKTDDQERICRQLADRLHWEVAGDVGHPIPNGVYTDHSRSAWQRNRKRPAWDQMLADVDAGRINAIAVYHGDRLVRRPEDLTDLMRLAESKGVKLASPTGTHDLDTQRLELWIRAAFAEEESTRTSERRKAQYDRMRREGKVRAGGRGGRAFGFATDGVTHVPAECELIREAARRILAGEGATAIAASWRERGVRGVTGSPPDHSTILKVLMRPRVAGLMPDGIAKAAWEPVLDPATWQMTCAVLSARAAGFGHAASARRHLLSGIAICVCGTPLQFKGGKGGGGGEGRPGRLGYACPPPGCRKIYRSQPHLDTYVTHAVVRRLASPANPAPAMPAGTAAAELGVLTRRRAEVVAVIENLAEHPGQRIDVLARALASFDEKITAAREQMTARAGAALVAAHAGISAKEFAAQPLAVRRELVRATFGITVMPASRRGPGFDPRDVILSHR